MCGCVCVSLSCYLLLRAVTAVDDHVRQNAVDDVEVRVHVEHADGRHAPRGAARPRRVEVVGLLQEVRVRVAVHEDEAALAAAVIGLVALRRDDPLPAKGLKVDGQRVATAAYLGALVVAELGRI